MTLGEFIVAAYEAWGERRGRGAVRLAIKTHLVAADEGPSEGNHSKRSSK